MGKHKKRNKRNKRRNKRRTHRKKVVHKKSKGFSSYTREFIHSRADGKCQFPDCDRAGSQCHHIVPKSIALNKYHWKISKINALDNGIYFCRRCHEKLHRNFEWKSFIPLFKEIIYNSTCN